MTYGITCDNVYIYTYISLVLLQMAAASRQRRRKLVATMLLLCFGAPGGVVR